MNVRTQSQGTKEALRSARKTKNGDQGHTQGAFSHSAGTAPIIALFIPGTPLKTTLLQKDARSIQNSIRGCRIQDPGTRGKHHTDKEIPGVPAGGLSGADVKTLGPVATSDGKQPTFRTARAQRRVRPLSHLHPRWYATAITLGCSCGAGVRSRDSQNVPVAHNGLRFPKAWRGDSRGHEGMDK